MSEFTAQEFTDVARVLQGEGGRTQQAAYMVLVDGATQGEASRAIGVSRGAISELCKRMRQLKAAGCPVCGQSLINGELK